MPGFPGFPGQQGKKGEVGQKGDTGTKGSRGDYGRALYGQKGQKGMKGTASSLGGVTYTRWGASACRTGASLVYSGRGGGAAYQKGGGANYLCMPNDPQYSLTTKGGIQGYSHIHGMEYEIPIFYTRNNDIVTCAVCYTTQHTSLMIPAKTTCPFGWTREYYGYLMSGHGSHERSEFICVDSSMGYLVTSHINGAIIYHVEASCNGLSCTSYNSAKELTCVVCTK